MKRTKLQASLVLRLTSPLPSDRPTSTAVLNELNDDASESELSNVNRKTTQVVKIDNYSLKIG